MIDLSKFTEEERSILTKYPEFGEGFRNEPALPSPGPISPQFTEEEKTILSKYPQLGGLREQYPNLIPPPIPAPERIRTISRITAATVADMIVSERLLTFFLSLSIISRSGLRVVS